MAVVKNVPAIPVQPTVNLIIVEQLKILSRVEKQQEKKDNKVVLTREAIANRNKQVLAEGGNISDVFDEHPKQGIIVAISDKQVEETTLRVGDKIAFHIEDNVGTLMVFNKKRYVGLYPHDILFRYLTKEV